jgi:aminodeoxyfutalosine deaminase
MTHQQYTRNVLIENPYKILRNRAIKTEGQIPDKCIICPAFINLHGHLSYSGQKIPSQNLFLWLIELVKTQTFDLQEMICGAREAKSFGTGFFVENSPRPSLSIEAMKKARLKGLIGIEVFGSDPEQAEELFKKYLEEYESLLKLLPESGDIDLCFSPHASYDVSPKLWELVLEWSANHRKPVLSHIAESQEEEIWHRNKEDPRLIEMKRFWESVNTLDEKLRFWQRYSGSVDFLVQNNLLNRAQLILTHLVYASKEDLEKLKRENISLVTCPRSNEYLKMAKVDLDLWQDLKLSFGIGTDSKASNYDLDLRKELNKLNLSAQKKLELLTSVPAKILGKQTNFGTLKLNGDKIEGEFVIFKVDDEDIDWASFDPLEFIFERVPKIYEPL